MLPRVLAGLVGLVLASTGITWIFDPTAAALSLGMPLLDGIARSTQIGDLSAIFVGGTILCFTGALRQEGHWLQAVALLLALIALFRTLAWAVHGAALADIFIAAELIMAAILLFSATQMSRAKTAAIIEE
jgi:uncharacterized membrane protein HdeD (DUF308 family)